MKVGIAMPTYRTIRQAAKQIDFPENRIRVMVKQGACPGVYSGNRFMVNIDALVEQLDAQSRRNSKVEAVTA